jgi:transcriptional regulator with XRE-family HTH domain
LKELFVNWTADEIRQLRHRLGYCQAEMARCLKLDLSIFSGWEAGSSSPEDIHRNALIMMMQQAESNAERIQRRPIAEIMMKAQNLSQIHELDVINCAVPGVIPVAIFGAVPKKPENN